MFINILIDIILLSMIIGGFIYGYKKGFLKMTLVPAKRLLCFVASFSYSGIVGSNIVSPIIKSIFEGEDNKITIVIVNA